MYNNNNFTFNKNVKCVLKNEDEVLATFEAREFQQKQEDANFVGGGTMSGGHSYAVSTDYDFKDLKINPYIHTVEIDGVLFRILRTIKTRNAVLIRKFKKVNFETVFYLG